jgi:hypothetical protein
MSCRIGQRQSVGEQHRVQKLIFMRRIDGTAVCEIRQLRLGDMTVLNMAPGMVTVWHCDSFNSGDNHQWGAWASASILWSLSGR